MKNLLKLVIALTALPMMAVVVIVGITLLGQCSDGVMPGPGTSTSAERDVSAAKVERLNYDQPVFSVNRAVVCNQSVLLAAAFSRRADSGIDGVYDAFTAIWNRREKVKAAGCEEWRAGIPLYLVHRMEAPFDQFVGFSVTPTGMAEYFTMEPFLRNGVASSRPILKEAGTDARPAEVTLNHPPAAEGPPAPVEPPETASSVGVERGVVPPPFAKPVEVGLPSSSPLQ